MSKQLNLSPQEIEYLFTPEAIRAQAKNIFERTTRGEGLFEYKPENLQSTIDYVMSVIEKNYPDFKIPFHSRWGHFRVGGIDRSSQLNQKLSQVSLLEKARTKLDLVITSVLLDAGAGAEWKFHEESSQGVYSRSEGLGVASFHMFLAQVMSAGRKSLQADAEGLQNLKSEDIREYFQVSSKNPLIGVEGRTQLLNNLGRALENKQFFKNGRPGNILDALLEKHGDTIPAKALVKSVLEGFGSIWPGRLSVGDTNLGDIWIHPKLGISGSFESLVPFHKLSQWLTYSLIEPIEEAGYKVTGVEGLTGLAEYRNGGLMIDSGLIQVKDPKALEQAWAPDSELVVEWRALTVHLLDVIGEGVQKTMGKSAQEFPLAKVLEGGTWWAGRFLAKEKRINGDPPLKIQSDGTVF